MNRPSLAALLSSTALGALVVMSGLGSVAACGGSTISGLSDADGGGGGNGTGNGTGTGTGTGKGSGNGSSGGSTDASTGEGGSTDGGKKVFTHAPAIHRATAVACSHDRGPGDPDPQIMNAMCSSDAECTMGTNGRCLVTTVAAHLNYCSYDACFTDADCGGQVCTCRELSNDANRCEAGNCKVDADCGAGGYCSPSADPDKTNFGTTGWWCHTATDACIDGTDCTGNGEKCVYDPTLSHWTCSSKAFLPP